LAAVVIGVLVGRATVKVERIPTVERTTDGADVLVPGRHSQTAAVAAAGQWLSAYDTRTELLDGAHRQRAVSRFVARAARQRLSLALSEAARQMSAGGQPNPVTRSASLGFKVLLYTPQRAVVATWEIVARSSLELAPSALWARSVLTLVWEDGWRIRASRVRAVPLDAWTPSRLAAMDVDYVPFRHVP
jgi:hypothetical protein